MHDCACDYGSQTTWGVDNTLELLTEESTVPHADHLRFHVTTEQWFHVTTEQWFHVTTLLHVTTSCSKHVTTHRNTSALKYSTQLVSWFQNVFDILF